MLHKQLTYPHKQCYATPTNMLSYIKNWNSSSTWWHWTYLLDWVLPIVVTFIVWLPFRYSRPYCGRRVLENDLTISFEYDTSATFPSWTLPLVAGVVPAAFCLLAAFFFKFRNRRELEQEGYSFAHDAHNIILSTLQSCLLAICLTDPLKNYAGRLRPDYLDRLKRAHLSPLDLTGICDSTETEVMDGRRSFPSGHASISFAGWTVACLFVFSRIPVRVRSTDVFWRVVILIPIMMFPSIVAVSRTRDNRHNFSDILAGSCIGVFAGVLIYSLHFYFNAKVPVNRKTEAAALEQSSGLSA